MLLFFMAAYIIVSIIIFCVYPRKDSLKICAIPLFLSSAALAALAANRIPLGFFSVAALVLVFGLGLDYIFYMTGGKGGAGGRLTLLGVVLSFLTTLLSFGALVLSSFMPVHIFGLTVSAGLGAAFISAMLLQSKND
jgi:predicted exporter